MLMRPYPKMAEGQSGPSSSGDIKQLGSRNEGF
jgi:hypothetical protein